ncbi:hypothetical protein [Clostridium sp. DJ247]|uniref:hypothetical protein n=1 Tax=Clostridium sp. DJ247 TaxID=2726188 RepID=UPI001624EFEF|nr:hypothetical protein [Clostridium sp. DJ247]MBC2581958.1 hypothetical protein [Clostridium sp. DJ247]
MEKISVNNKTSTEEILKRFKEHQIKKEKLLCEERNNKREETHKKFEGMREILKESIRVQEIITNITDELKFNIKDSTKANYAYYLFLILTTIFVAVILWSLNVMHLNVKYFFIPTILVFMLINWIVFYIISHITQRKIYTKYINNCKDTNINNEDIFELISVLLDNNIKIVDILPNTFFSYFTKEYNKNNLDIYIGFLCKNNKFLLKKYKNKKLRLYKEIYSRNTELLLDIEELENNYFQSKLKESTVDTIEECIEKFLQDK